MNNNQQFLIKFYGVRGSHPVSSTDILKYGGNTSCVLVKAGNHNIILDSGTGIISLGKQLAQKPINKNINATILISHYHLDHILGFQYFQPSFIASTNINLFGTKNFDSDLSDIMKNFLNQHFSPVSLDERSAKININNISESQTIFIYDNEDIKIYESTDLKALQDDNIVKINCLRSLSHPKDGSTFYKINWKGKSIVYASDHEGHDDNNLNLIEFAKNSDILIHDSQYTENDYNSIHFPKHGFGHSTLEMATKTAINANVKKLVLFHYDPTYNDDVIDSIETQAKKIFPNTIASYEGLELDLFS